VAAAVAFCDVVCDVGAAGTSPSVFLFDVVPDVVVVVVADDDDAVFPLRKKSSSPSLMHCSIEVSSLRISFNFVSSLQSALFMGNTPSAPACFLLNWSTNRCLSFSVGPFSHAFGNVNEKEVSNSS
jgi:hypothetical protein